MEKKTVLHESSCFPCILTLPILLKSHLSHERSYFVFIFNSVPLLFRLTYTKKDLKTKVRLNQI